MKQGQVNILFVILFKFSSGMEFGGVETLVLKLDMNMHNYQEIKL